MIFRDVKTVIRKKKDHFKNSLRSMYTLLVAFIETVFPNFVSVCTKSLIQPGEVDIIPILWMRKLRLRDQRRPIQGLAMSHT